MPASKKDLKKNQQKKNVAAGIGDEKGRLPSQNKVATFGSYRYRVPYIMRFVRLRTYSILMH
jgi:hypothetical protein